MSEAGRWYGQGLKFECTQCGKCCGGAPGTVLVSELEMASMAASLELSADQFREMYTRTLPSGLISLRERPSYDCVFYGHDRGCTIYSVRPQQCRTWPFWRGNLATRAHWEEAAGECPGIDQGDLHSAAEITRTAASDGATGFIPELPGS